MLESQFGDGDIRLIHVLRPLAALLVEDGELGDAVELQRRIYAMSLKFWGNPNLPAVDEARKALATSLQSLGRFDEAIPLFQAAVTEDGDETLAGALVDCLKNVGRVEEATAICCSMVGRFEQDTTDKGFGGLLTWLMNLSRCYSKRGYYATAAEVMERTIPLMAARAEVMCIPQLDVLSELYRQAGNMVDHDRVRNLRREIADRCDY